MSSLFTLFDILAIVYILRSIQLAITIGRQWPEFTSEPLTSQKKSLADQAAFFIAVPISVFIHEAAHALAVIAVGGEVAEFKYRAFYGYVVPRGSFTAAELWLIAIAGTVGSILFGIGLWLWLRNASSSSVRYFALRAFRFQIYFSLIYYPLFTLFGFDGDWRVIYDFTRTPILSAATAVIHLAILFLFWRLDRQGWFEAPAFSSAAAQEQFTQLVAAAEINPQDIALELQRIDALRRGGAAKKAHYRLEKLLQAHPDSALAHLEMAMVQSSGKSSVPKNAAEHASTALRLGLATPRQQAYAHQLLAQYQLERGQLSAASSNLSQAIGLAASEAKAGLDPALIELYILRSQVFRRQQNFNAAYQDLQQAMAIAQQISSAAAMERINSEMEILAKHAGQPMKTAAAESGGDYYSQP